MYRLLLLLLPPQRRAMYGAEMNDVFVTLCAHARQERGWVGVIATWMKEALGMTKFAWRERGGGSPDVRLHETRGPRPFNRDEWRWAWRGVRARRWRAVFIGALFALAMGANAVVFAAADAFVFRSVPYMRPHELVVLQRPMTLMGETDYTNAQAIDEWRKHTDLFSGVQGHERGRPVLLTSNGVTESIPAQQVTPGMFELLGVVPTAGRPFVASDAKRGAPAVVVISDGLARRLFGDPDRALGKSFFTGTETPTVIGVMPASFRFPGATQQIWQPLDLETWDQPAYTVGLRHIARLQTGVSHEQASQMVNTRWPSVLASLPGRSRNTFTRKDAGTTLTVRSLSEFSRHSRASSVFAMLAGAAICLLLIACANAASLELSAAASRMRIFAVQAALGASRGSLLRVTLLEGMFVVGLSTIAGATLAWWGTNLLSTELTPEMRTALANPIDVDMRTVAFMVVIAAVAWVLTALPAVLRISRLSVSAGLRHDPRVMPVSSGAARARQWLMTAQVGLTVMLLVGALLYIRTYERRIGVEKGLDSNSVVTLQIYPAPDAKVDKGALEADVLARLRSLPQVRSAARTWALPPSTEAGSFGQLHIAGRIGPVGSPKLSSYDVDPDYFDVMGISVAEGHLFSDDSPMLDVVIDERFAAAFWPDASALGAQFQIGGADRPSRDFYHVVGVTREMRTDTQLTPEGNPVFVVYQRIKPKSHPLAFVVKVTDERAMAAIASTARSTGPRLRVLTDTVDLRYARLYGDTRLAAAITGAFGVLAWVIATAGIFAVMAFLVAGRTREIGIRMALGADRGNVLRMILGSSMKFVAAGTALGLAAAAAATQYISAQLFGVTATDPLTYAGVAALVITTAALATWWPARQAARVDPAITLRAE